MVLWYIPYGIKHGIMLCYSKEKMSILEFREWMHIYSVQTNIACEQVAGDLRSDSGFRRAL